jgi:hypothetical protein
MAAKARITSEFATPRDVASRLRIRPSRAAELRRQVIELHPRKPEAAGEKPETGTARAKKK